MSSHRTPDTAVTDRCGRWILGHDPHPTQLRLSAGTGVPGRVTVETDGWLTIETAEETVRRWHHRPEHLVRLIAERGPEFEVRSQGVLLQRDPTQTEPPYRCAVFSVAPDRSSCGSEPDVDEGPISAEELVARIHRGEGFLGRVTPAGGSIPGTTNPLPLED